ncbi:MAG: hypothetical protein ACFFDH_22265 [Promethearchaeota archaeon]
MKIDDSIGDLEILNDYLCEIKKNLPLSIRLKKKETNSILEEIEDHIWEKVIENIGDRDPRREDIKNAISEMGSPVDIANDYPVKGTPFIYISEDFYPIYLKWLKILFGFFILSIFFFPIDLFVLGIICLFFFSTFLFVTIIFFYLSSNGYLPGDLRRIYRLKTKKKEKLFFEKKIKKPVNKRHLLLWSFLWIFCIIGSIFNLINVLSLSPHYIIANALEVIIFGLLFFILILVVDLTRYFFDVKFMKVQHYLLILKTSLLFSYSIFPLISNPRYAIIYDIRFLIYIALYGIPYYLPIYEVASILVIWISLYGFLYYNFYKIITFKEKVEKYLIDKSLEKRYLKKKSYLNSNFLKSTENPKPKSNKGKVINREYQKVHKNKVQKSKIENFIQKIEKELPKWLTPKDKEILLIEIEDTIQEIALEYSGKNELTDIGIDQALKHIGSVKSIVSELKQRSKPKIYLSKELWSWFILISKIVVIYIFFIAFYLKIYELISSNSFGEFSQIFTYTKITQFGIYINNFIIAIFLLISTIFVMFVFISMKEKIPYHEKYMENKDWIKKKSRTIICLEASQIAFYIIFSVILLVLTFQLAEESIYIIVNIFLICSSLILFGVIKLIKLFLENSKIKIKRNLSLISVILNIIIIFLSIITIIDGFSTDFSYFIRSFIFVINIILIIQLFSEISLYFFYSLKNKKNLITLNAM